MWLLEYSFTPFNLNYFGEDKLFEINLIMNLGVYVRQRAEKLTN